MAICLEMDFETRSLVDLTKTTTDRYAEDPSTEVLCLAIKREGEPTKWWVPPTVREKLDHGSDIPNEIFSAFLAEMVLEADIIEAHNAGFETALWHHVMVKRHGFPEIPADKWRCSAAKAAMHSLPRSLAGAADALKLEVHKSKEGKALMMSMCRPRPPLQAQYKAFAEKYDISLEQAKLEHKSADMKKRWYLAPGDKELIRWKEDADSLTKLIEYCIQDVESEHALSTRLKNLPEAELKIWQLTEEINNRGLPVDLEAVDAMMDMVHFTQEEIFEEFRLLTGGEVDSPSCYVGFANWVRSQGVPCSGVSKGAIEELLERPDLPSHVRAALRIAQDANKSSTAKYAALKRGCSSDSRIRGTLLYHGAGTGRWTGKLFQPQNLPRGSFSDVDDCIDAVVDRDFDYVDMMWGSKMDAASTCIRGMIKASDGHELIAADFSAIEGRVIAWLAGEESELDIYRAGKDPYVAVAASAFGTPYSEIMEALDKEEAWAKDMRFKGKTGCLACGFGGGKNAVKRFAPDMPLAEAADLVRRWREAHPKTKQFWYDLTDAASSAIRFPNKTFLAGKIQFHYRPQYGFLMCKLPSGRILYYADPECHKELVGSKVAARKAMAAPGSKHYFAGATYWVEGGQLMMEENGEEPKAVSMEDLWERESYQIRAWTVDSVTKRWVKRDLSHVTLSNNVTQATARDLMTHGLLNTEGAGYRTIFSVHDEVIAEVLIGFGSVKEFEDLLCDLPPWAEGLPIKAEGWRAKRFKK